MEKTLNPVAISDASAFRMVSTAPNGGRAKGTALPITLAVSPSYTDPRTAVAFAHVADAAPTQVPPRGRPV